MDWWICFFLLSFSWEPEEEIKLWIRLQTTALKHYYNNAWCKVGHCVHLACMKVVFRRCLLIVLQTVLLQRADPTELKATFQKVRLILTHVLLFSFVFASYQRSFSLTIRFTVVSLWSNSKAQHASLCLCVCFSPPLQYAILGKNDSSFMLPEDLVSHFLHAHTDIQLSDEAANLLARVVDQNKEVGVLMFLFSYYVIWYVA